MNFIFAFDGPDASGKTLIAQLVAEDLKLRYRDKGFQVHAHRMPGGTSAGAEIRKLLKNPEIEIAPLTERLLFAADAAEFFHRLVQQTESCERSIHIVDRWSPITEFMYGIPRGITREELMKVIGVYLNGELAVRPDLLFLVDVALLDMQSRLSSKGRPSCRIEKLGDQYHNEVWSLYRDAAQRPDSEAHGHCKMLAHEVCRLDNTEPAVRTVRQVADRAIEVIDGYLSEDWSE